MGHLTRKGFSYLSLLYVAADKSMKKNKKQQQNQFFINFVVTLKNIMFHFILCLILNLIKFKLP
mgnify:CR=1 FL=1